MAIGAASRREAQGLDQLVETGLYAPAEASVLQKPKLLRPAGAAYPAVFGHMLFGTAYTAQHPLWGPPEQLLAKAGMNVISRDAQGTFGNDPGIARYQDGYDYALLQGANPSHLFYLSISMGTMGLNWVRQHLDKVRACALMLPAPAMDTLRDTAWSSGNLQPYIDAAFPPSWPSQGASFKYAHDPQRFAAELEGLPIRLFADVNDPFYLESPMYQDFIAAVGGSAIDMVTFSGGGHTLDNFDPALPLEFFLEHLP